MAKISTTVRSILTVILCIFLYGCYSEISVVEMQIVSYPSKLIYIAGRDSSLDLSEGKIQLVLRDKSIVVQEMDAIDYGVEISHSINFDNPGVYSIKISSGVSCYSEFEIAIISEEQFIELCDCIRN